MFGILMLVLGALLSSFLSYAGMASTSSAVSDYTLDKSHHQDIRKDSTAAASIKSEKTVLTLTNENIETLKLSMGQLNALSQHEITTSTPWHSEARTFSGPSFTDVLALGGIRSTRVEIVSINGYQITLSPDELTLYDPILATHVDGEEMRIRDNGPIWLILPLDQYPNLHNSAFYAQMAWQIKSIHSVKD
ncbi:hypothetical protein [Plesiomonas sp.]|uniref:hypothetical protein n=1 Tax=Plesiomonas sp. TaxID=2486279 RepID=UPI003F2C375B